jgi:hypothetical protein
LPEDYLPVDVSSATALESSNSPNPSKKKRKSSLMSTNGSSHHLLTSKEDLLGSNGNGKKDKKRKTPHLETMHFSEREIASPKSRQTVGSREKLLEAEAIAKSNQQKLQEFCFLCRVEENKSSGQMILCDFPDCYRAYHTVSLSLAVSHMSHLVCLTQVCVAGRLGEFNSHSSDASTSPWFCPAHFCTICCSMEISKSQIDAYPLEILTLSLHLNPVDLQQCSTCPFSICYSCSSEITGHRGRKSIGKPSSTSTAADSLNGNGSVSGGSHHLATSLFKTMSTQFLKLNGIRSPQYAVMLSKKTGNGPKKVSSPSPPSFLTSTVSRFRRQKKTAECCVA